MGFTLFWIIAATTPQGLYLQDVRETVPAKFNSHLECKDYAEATTDRMADWFRGRINAPLQMPVRVSWRCEPQERPA